jgi:hypothetical protein
MLEDVEGGNRFKSFWSVQQELLRIRNKRGCRRAACVSISYLFSASIDAARILETKRSKSIQAKAGTAADIQHLRIGSDIVYWAQKVHKVPCHGSRMPGRSVVPSAVVPCVIYRLVHGVRIFNVS